MLGTIVNVATVLLGTLLGCVFRKGIPERLKHNIMQALGLCVVLIGISGAIKTADTMCVILSMVLGTLLGSAVGIEKGLNGLGLRAEKLLTKGQAEEGNTFAKAFVTASLVFCVGAMAIVGSLDSGLRGDHTTLFAKSALDGVASIIFASTLGAGVALSALAVLIYQGSITILSGLVAPLLSSAVILEMSAVGGLLIVGIGVNMLLDKEIPVGDMLPAIFVPLLYLPIVALF